MACFIVSYRLRSGINFGPLIDELTGMGGIEFQPSTWLVRQDATTSDIFVVLERILPTSFDDPLLIARVSEKPRIMNFREEVREWLAANF